MNVVFGNLSSSDILFFLNHVGIPGLTLAVLYSIGICGFRNYPSLSKSLSVASSTLPERYQVVLGSGFIYEPYSKYQAGFSAFFSLKGRVFVKLVEQIYIQ